MKNLEKNTKIKDARLIYNFDYNESLVNTTIPIIKFRLKELNKFRDNFKLIFKVAKNNNFNIEDCNSNNINREKFDTSYSKSNNIRIKVRFFARSKKIEIDLRGHLNLFKKIDSDYIEILEIIDFLQFVETQLLKRLVFLESDVIISKTDLKSINKITTL